MFKTLLKIVLGLAGVAVLLVAGLLLTLFLTLRASPPDNFFELAGTPPGPGAAPVLIVGGTRGTGLEVARVLHARGEQVIAVVRPTSDRTALEALNAEFIVGDATNPDDMNAALASRPFRAVVSTIGCISCEPPPDFIGNRNIVDAAKAAGVRRMVLVSSLGVGDSADAVPFLSKIFLAKILPLKEQAEQHLRDIGLDYTIIRPGGLAEGREPSGGGYLSEDPMAFGFIVRADLARLVVGSLDDPRTIGKTFSAADLGIESPFGG